MQNIRFLYTQKFLTIVSLLLLLSFFACEKEDETGPVISIQNPTGGNYSVLDTINISATISDNEVLKRLTIRIIDENNQQVCTPYTYSLNQANYKLDAKYIIDNIYLESGSYHLVIEADDNYNTSKAYVKIQLGALARTLDNILIVEKEYQQCKIYSILNDKKLLKSFAHGYQDFIYNPFAEQYIFLTENGVMIAYDKINLEEQWRVENLKKPNSNYYGGLYYKDQLTHVSNHLGEIRTYDSEGTLRKQANTIDDSGQISQYYFDHGKIMAVKNPYVNDNDKIEELNEGTGASVWTYKIQFTPENLHFVDDELCVVFGNQYNKAKACSLSTMYHVVHPFGEFNDRKLGDSFKASKYFYLLSIDQEIVAYNLSNGDERLIENTSSIVKFFYEDLYETLLFVDNDKISNLNYPSTGSQVFYQNNTRIDDVIFVYNK